MPADDDYLFPSPESDNEGSQVWEGYDSPAKRAAARAQISQDFFLGKIDHQTMKARLLNIKDAEAIHTKKTADQEKVYSPFDWDTAEQQRQERMGDISQYHDQIQAGTTSAQQQQQQAMRQGMGAAGSVISANGFSPSAARGAGLASARIESTGGIDAMGVKAGEMQNYHSMYEQALQDSANTYMTGMGLEQQYLTDAQKQKGAELSAGAQAYAQARAGDVAEGQAIQGAAGSAGQVMANSDERVKEFAYEQGRSAGRDEAQAIGGQLDEAGLRTSVEMAERGGVTPEDRDNAAILRRLHNSAYRYKPDFAAEHGLTRRLQHGPTAQELSEAGSQTRSLVYNDADEGLKVDTSAATMQQFGMLSGLARRLDQLERERREKAVAEAPRPDMGHDLPEGY